eukprot:TRINITY_DN50413_c0_g1_i1.p3 TRINITY_DN50413_c0_g1~~TRINITY_DN50413_c0_g1_i1.p3  ORF type:complete len:318 (+),score=63.50 TRINITY_DN50413_c0_g1_i1:69-956(+)
MAAGEQSPSSTPPAAPAEPPARPDEQPPPPAPEAPPGPGGTPPAAPAAGLPTPRGPPGLPTPRGPTTPQGRRPSHHDPAAEGPVVNLAAAGQRAEDGVLRSPSRPPARMPEIEIERAMSPPPRCGSVTSTSTHSRATPRVIGPPPRSSRSNSRRGSDCFVRNSLGVVVGTLPQHASPGAPGHSPETRGLPPLPPDLMAHAIAGRQATPHSGGVSADPPPLTPGALLALATPSTATGQPQQADPLPPQPADAVEHSELDPLRRRGSGQTGPCQLAERQGCRGDGAGAPGHCCCAIC